MNFKDLKDLFDDYSKKQFRVVGVVLLLVMLFTMGVIAGDMASQKDVDFSSVIENVINNTQSADNIQSQPANPDMGGSSSSSSENQGTSDEGAADVGASDGDTTSTSGEMTKAEIIELFNTSANKVKTDAVKVTKNFEDRTHMEEHLVLPEILEGMAKDLMAEAFKDDTEPIVYATKEDIVANYQVPGQTWVSQLTEAEVMEATCKDNGTEYEIYMKLHPTTNPEPGNGVAKAFDTITSSEVAEKAPSILKEFTTEYYDCVINCKIDKATGRMTWANYDSPLILKLKVDFFGTLDAQVGMRYAKDYTIEY